MLAVLCLFLLIVGIYFCVTGKEIGMEGKETAVIDNATEGDNGMMEENQKDMSAFDLEKLRR